jgi:cellobiose transport system substrate-binding protein
MLGYIKGQAGDAAAGTWDVMTLPGGAGGNWGGSYLAVPEKSEAKEEATKLVAWLTAPEQQQTIFDETGSFPSNTEAIGGVGDVTNEYFMAAPVGEILGTSSEAAPVQVIGVNDGIYRTQLSNALQSVEVNRVSAGEAWKKAGASIENQVG